MNNAGLFQLGDIFKSFARVGLFVLLAFGSFLNSNAPYAPEGDEQAIVWIHAGPTGSGSGIMVESGVILTAKHVIGQVKNGIKIYFVNAGAFTARDAEVIYLSPVADLAILMPILSNADITKKVALCTTDIIRAGGPAIIWGFPLQTYPKAEHFNRYEIWVVPRKAKAHEEFLDHFKKKPPEELGFVSSASYQKSLYFAGRAYHGNSGGPIIFENSNNGQACVGGILSTAAYRTDSTSISGRAESIETMPNLDALKTQFDRAASKRAREKQNLRKNETVTH